MYKCEQINTKGSNKKNKAEEMFDKYCEILPEDAYEVCIEVRKDLKGDSFEDFSMACNFLLGLNYRENDVPYEEIKSLKEEANNKVREILGTELSDLYDNIVSVSKQELWLGDELYTLYGYSVVPAYVQNCLVSAICVYCMMKYINTNYTVLKMAKYIYHPNVSWKVSDVEEECNILREIAKYLYNKDIDGAYNLIKDKKEIQEV